MKSTAGAWLAWGALAVAVVLLAFHLLDDNNLEIGPRRCRVDGAMSASSSSSPPLVSSFLSP